MSEMFFVFVCATLILWKVKHFENAVQIYPHTLPKIAIGQDSECHTLFFISTNNKGTIFQVYGGNPVHTIYMTFLVLHLNTSSEYEMKSFWKR